MAPGERDEGRIEPVVVLRHTTGSFPCDGIAMHVTLSYLESIYAGEALLKCRSCFRLLTLDDTEGDEPYTPSYSYGAER